MVHDRCYSLFQEFFVFFFFFQAEDGIRDLTVTGVQTCALPICGVRQPCPACVRSRRNFCMSQAPVGQRSAHRPQCRHTSSSLTITLPVFSSPDTYRSCVGFLAGALRRPRRSASSPFRVKLMQSIGQMSTQASHSMHSLSANTVCTSQFRQRCASLNPVIGSKPSSTSTLMFFRVIFWSFQGTL